MRLLLTFLFFAATILAAPETTLRYTAPAQKWVEALPVGNGRLGAMVFGGIASERLQINEDTFFGGGPYDPVNPEAHDALPEVRSLIAARRYEDAAALVGAKVLARPANGSALAIRSCRVRGIFSRPGGVCPTLTISPCSLIRK